MTLNIVRSSEHLVFETTNSKLRTQDFSGAVGGVDLHIINGKICGKN